MSSLVEKKPRIPRFEYDINTEEEIPKLREVIPGWGTSSSEDSALIVEPIIGGITNRIYKLSNPRQNPCSVLVRIFGGETIFTPSERQQENAVFEELGKIGVAPKLIALFGNGRVEAFLNSRAIVLDEMVDPVVMTGVARAMAKLHKFEPSGGLELSRSPGVWADIDKWVPEVLNLREKNSAFVEKLSVNLDKCVKGLQDIRKALAERQSSSPIVFCHNDLLCGNILRSLNQGTAVSIVDFEYSSFNYRGFDIGNFFCEAMGGTQDGYIDASRYPSSSARRLFCRKYLEEFCGCQPEEYAVSELVAEAEEYGMLAHLYWGFWGLVQSVTSPVDFPYALFADQRFTRFFEKYSP
ncbi:Choline/ethanolamine kinase, putative [Chondrus crispus]|uniref:Choline/ethanolamine kinase, putative n=1 Tax=Chondrus crispus TaxID=2769 RepID=R7QAF8_CHOCR|nr:Choline/ethanolamine kinase, putative [Chondrus crispus]CDF35029.1 Choline/ethanolamine kinase, putative [Chondrus crispus]|eukprot:XP_005714848.1 Choline/ethanolamine kinase, putative [Chondrus crispus]